MKRKHSRLYACLSLVLCVALLLCGCPAPDSGDGTSSTTTPPVQKPSDPTPTVYGNPAPLSGTGDSIKDGDAVLETPVYDESAFTAITAAGLRDIFRKDTVTPDQMLRLESGSYSFNSKEKLRNGAGMILIAPGGILIENADGMTLADITVIGTLTVKNSPDVKLDNVKIVAKDGTALSVDEASSGLMIRNSRIEGKTAIESSADSLRILDSFVGFAENGILDLSRAGLYVRNCRFAGTAGSALKTASANAEIRKSTVSLPVDATAIVVGETKNVLVAECKILDAQKAVVMNGSDNSVIVRNTLISAQVQNAKHIYICDNAMGGKLSLSDIDYILADGNSYPADGYNHTADKIGLANANGDSITDVDARPAAGANEELLPHVDRDQFFGEERKEQVYDPDGSMEFGKYVMAHAATDDIIIIAPGAYKTTNSVNLGKNHSNTRIYAYGVFSERAASGGAGYEPLDNHFDLDYAENITVKGGTYGYESVGHAQAHVIEKIPGTTRIRLKAAAGYPADVGLSNTKLFNRTTYGYREGESYFYLDTHHSSATLGADGTVIMTLSLSTYESVKVGDVITTRPSHGAPPVSTDYSKDIVYQDMTVFATMAGVCFHEYYNENSVTYFRVADTYRSGLTITKEEYDAYRALEKQYGITTEVFYDEEHDCYRGPAGRNASLDGVHVVASKGGAQILSSLFERLADDGTNQFAYTVRLSSFRDNGDGTMDIIIKGVLSSYNYINGTLPSSRWAHMTHKPPVTEGDPIMIYTAKGDLVLDAIALADESAGPKLKNDADLVKDGGKELLDTLRVRVKITEYHAESLTEYLPYLDTYTDDNSAILDSHYNSYHEEYRVYFHVGGYASAGARVENTKVDCCRSRAALLRSPNSTIKNCTYRHIGGPAIGVLFEPFYASESAVVRNMTIENNLIDHVHYNFAQRAEGGAISVDAPGTPDLSRAALFYNIVVKGNVFRNRASEYAIYFEGIADIVIENNTLGERGNMLNLLTYNKAIRIENAVNVKIEGNKYPNKTMSIESALSLSGIRGLTGSDVDNGEMFPEFQ